MASRDLSPSALRLTQEFAPNPALSEPRSFARSLVKLDPIKPPATLPKAIAAVFQVHACVEDHKEQTAEGFKQVDAKIVAIQEAMRLHDPSTTVAGLSTPRQAFWRTVRAVSTAIGAVAAAGVVIRFVVAATPGLREIGHAVWVAILAGKI